MKYDYIVFFEEKLRELAKEKRVLDLGGGSPFQKQMAKYRSWFKGVRYETVDLAPTYNPTFIGDVHDLPVESNSVEAALSLSVLEHLYDPPRAVRELYRIMRSGGKVLLYTHFIYPYHARGNVYEDYFRFTESGLRELFKDFSHIEIKKQGGYFRALGFFLPAQARWRFLWEPVAYALDKLLRTEKRSTTPGMYVYAVK